MNEEALHLTEPAVLKTDAQKAEVMVNPPTFSPLALNTTDFPFPFGSVYVPSSDYHLSSGTSNLLDDAWSVAFLYPNGLPFPLLRITKKAETKMRKDRTKRVQEPKRATRPLFPHVVFSGQEREVPIRSDGSPCSVWKDPHSGEIVIRKELLEDTQKAPELMQDICWGQEGSDPSVPFFPPPPLETRQEGLFACDVLCPLLCLFTVFATLSPPIQNPIAQHLASSVASAGYKRAPTREGTTQSLRGGVIFSGAGNLFAERVERMEKTRSEQHSISVSEDSFSSVSEETLHSTHSCVREVDTTRSSVFLQTKASREGGTPSRAVPCSTHQLPLCRWSRASTPSTHTGEGTAAGDEQNSSEKEKESFESETEREGKQTSLDLEKKGADQRFTPAAATYALSVHSSPSLSSDSPPVAESESLFSDVGEKFKEKEERNEQDHKDFEEPADPAPAPAPALPALLPLPAAAQALPRYLQATKASQSRDACQRVIVNRVMQTNASAKQKRAAAEERAADWRQREKEVEKVGREKRERRLKGILTEKERASVDRRLQMRREERRAAFCFEASGCMNQGRVRGKEGGKKSCRENGEM
uniref:Uncharacterized protein n=1 Tax=Chromera velia CCMP2878 TaxID=1169474 RepID=A0A0G4HVU7_9ALVE|eukprot:Cvel_8879.t1-p1 / transcript=Cvel_8879.t1 / gene=Cvel_8879 / organism=Chromera_velia_CCMP2878 / gene_product=hypothetical protein / transcript_product=hypothetical protein / location=Cvel_scaffold499:59084-60844(+) / protein_length=587 / sequence_SO=supercontig / SO=protein_coding / is_pseudo=false